MDQPRVAPRVEQSAEGRVQYEVGVSCIVDDQATVVRLLSELAVVVARFGGRPTVDMLPAVQQLMQQRGEDSPGRLARQVSAVQRHLAHQAKPVMSRLKPPQRPPVEPIDSQRRG